MYPNPKTAGPITYASRTIGIAAGANKTAKTTARAASLRIRLRPKYQNVRDRRHQDRYGPKNSAQSRGVKEVRGGMLSFLAAIRDDLPLPYFAIGSVLIKQH
jgi:hypothetical protein